MPEVINGIKIAKLFDGTRDGVPFVVDRPAQPAGAKRSKFLDYLGQGIIVMRAAGRSVDRPEESQGEVVPTIFLTDGEWAWSASIAYCLEKYDLPPEPAFLEYLRSRDFRYTEPGQDQVTAAAQAVRGD